MRDLTRDEGLDELVWLVVFREGPLNIDALQSRITQNHGLVTPIVERLLQSGRLQIREENGIAAYESAKFYIPMGDTRGWTAAVLDHFQAMVTTLCTKLRQHSEASERDEVGGSTYTFVVWPGHPLEAKVRKRLQSFREQSSELRARVDEYNQSHGIPDHYQDVVSYAGQCIRERGEQNRDNK